MNRPLSRRLLLRGAGGIVVALPLLSLEARADTPAPKRFVFCYHPNGVFTPQWFPTAGTSETDFTINAIHAPLAPFRNDCLWLSGLDMKVAVTGNGEQHQRGLGAVLTGQKLDSGAFVGNDGTRAGWAMGESVDQTIVGLVGQTPVKSLQLGINAKERDVSGCCSYAGANQPLLPQNDPQVTFKDLFTDVMAPPDALEKIRRRRVSVLDAVRTQLASVKRDAGADAKQRLDAHLTKVRELELRLTALPPGTCAVPADPGTIAFSTEAAMPEVAKLQIELMVLAFQCDLTRVATFMFSDAKNHISLPFLNIAGDVHNLSHLSDSDPMREQLALRDTWQAQQFASILDKLNQAHDKDGSTLLQNSMVFWGSDVSRGNVHAHDDMPFIVAGHAGGWRMGRFLKYSSLPHNNLLASMVNAFGGSVSTYGDPANCTGPLTNLT